MDRSADVFECAQVLWACTARLTAASSGDEGQLAKARRVLAEMVSNKRLAGFLTPVEPDATDRGSEAWKRCVAAAMEASAGGGTGSIAALLWPGAAGQTPPLAPTEGHDLSWPTAAGTTLSDVIGPLRDGDGREVWLFVYSTVDAKASLENDADTGEGLFPRGTLAGAPTSLLQTAREGAVHRRAGAWAWVLFAAALMLTAFTMVWVYAAAEFTRGAAAIVLGNAVVENVGTTEQPKFEIRKNGVAVSAASDGCLLALQTRIQGLTEVLDRAACDTAWSSAWARQNPGLSRDRGAWQSAKRWFWQPTDSRGQVSLLWPLAVSAVAIVLLVLASGIALQNYFLGALIDERNRISLSRLQQLAWTVVLFGGFTILGIFNIALLAGYVRELGQSAALQEAVAGAGMAQDFWGFFPSMDPALWAVLGIAVLVSPYLSQRILTAKEPEGTSVDVRSVEVRAVAPEPLNRHGTPDEARWSDLFTGEAERNAGYVDVSRLQHLVITALLVGGYVVLLIEYVRTLDGAAILLAMLTGAPLFSAMPPIDATFVGLLALSHAGYLAFKALPATKPGTKE